MNKSRSSAVNKSQSKDDERAELKRLYDLKDKVKLCFAPKFPQEEQEDIENGKRQIETEKEVAYIRLRNLRDDVASSGVSPFKGMMQTRDSGTDERRGSQANTDKDRPPSHYSKASKTSQSKQSEADSNKFRIENIGTLAKLVAPTTENVDDMNLLFHHTEVSF